MGFESSSSKERELAPDTSVGTLELFNASNQLREHHGFALYDKVSKYCQFTFRSLMGI